MAEKQSHKDTILIWQEAVELYDQGELQKSLHKLQAIIEPSARLLYNIGQIQLVSSGQGHSAVQSFKHSIEKDQHMGIAHFQLAHTYYQDHNYEEAWRCYEKARNCLRGNKFIDYKQLGLQYKLYECEISHNQALTYAALNDFQTAITLMTEALQSKSEVRHNVIESAIKLLEQGSLPQPFTVPKKYMFRPPAAKVQNIKGVDYLGKATVVSELVVPDGDKQRGRSPSPQNPRKHPPPEQTRPQRLPPQRLPPQRPSPQRPSPQRPPPQRPPPQRPPPQRLPPQRLPHKPPPHEHPSPKLASPSSDAFQPIELPSRPSPINPKSPPSRPLPSSPSRSSPQLIAQLPPHQPTSPSPTPHHRQTHKDTIYMWNEGVLLFERGQVGPALDQMLEVIDPPAKILFNIGVLNLKLGNLEDANEVFSGAVEKDAHLAIGHYQLGNVKCQLNRPYEAKECYDRCIECFRAHKSIDYRQLGLPYKLYEFEVLHNQAWAFCQLGQRERCKQLLKKAQGTTPETRHDAIDTSLKNALAGAPFAIMELPKRALFHPPKAKIDALTKIDFLGHSQVVSEIKQPSPSHSSTTLDPPLRSVPQNSTQQDQMYTYMQPSKSDPRTPTLFVRQPTSNNDDLPLPIPPRSSSLGTIFTDNHDPSTPPSPGPPKRPIPPIPIEDASLPQNGIHTNNDSDLLQKPAQLFFDPNKPLPVTPSLSVDESPNAVARRRASPIPPDKPLPPSPRRGSLVPAGRKTPGPPDRPLPPSPNRNSPVSPLRSKPKQSSSPLPPSTRLSPLLTRSVGHVRAEANDMNSTRLPRNGKPHLASNNNNQ